MTGAGSAGILKVALRALAPLAVMGLIFYLSDQPNLHTDLGLIDTIGRKLIHLGSYAALGWLWAWALSPVLGNPIPVAAAIAIAWAISDEFHQTHVEGRTGSPVDVLIDGAGIALGLWLYGRRRT